MRYAWILLCALLAMVLAGCGGGGGGTPGSSGGSGTGSATALYLTDNLSATYSGVWVRIHELELEGPDGSATIFRSDTGVEVNLRALSDGAPLFRFLAVADIPNRRYSGARVTTSRSVTLVPTGGGAAITAFIDPSLNVPSNRSRIPVNFPTSLTVSAPGNLVIDFDLANWTLTGGIIAPVVRKGDDSTLTNLGRHFSEDFEGSVTNLTGTAPNQRFVLTNAFGLSVPVQMSATTTLINEQGAGNPALSNAQRVEVYGRFDPSSRMMLAATVTIEDTQGPEAKGRGVVTAVNLAAGTLTLRLTSSRGFLPSSGTLVAIITESTRAFNDAGLPLTRAELLNIVAAGSFPVEVEGSYSVANNTLTATHAKIELDGLNGDQEAKGAVTASSLPNGTLSIEVREWEGFAWTPSAVLNIVTTVGTQYRDTNGTTLTQTQFFGGLGVTNAAKVEGRLNGTTMTATKLQLRTGFGGIDGQESRGQVVSVDQANRRFALRLSNWSGWNGGFGNVVTINLRAGATYRDDNGSSLTEQQMFNRLSSLPLVEAEGQWDGAVFQASKVKIDRPEDD